MNDTATSTAVQVENRWKPYPAYKDSGVEWLGEIPEHWDIEPLKYMVHFINGAPFKPTDWRHEGIPIIRIENLNEGTEFNSTNTEVDPKYHVQSGDLLFAWSGNRGTSFGPFLWTREGLHYLNQHIFRLANFTCDKKWFYWVLKGVTAYVEKQAHGIIGLVHITKSELGIICIPKLSQHEQHTIATFLDRETAYIDALIAKKERLIELLTEQRSALISHTVTNGLDPTVPMKDSGMEWLGEIPAHWEILPLRRFVNRIEQGWSPNADGRMAEEHEWAVIKISAVSKGVFKQEEHKALPENLTPEKRYEIRRGDFLLTRSNTPELVGDVCLVRQTRPNLLLCDLVYRITTNDNSIDKNFLAYWFLSSTGRMQIRSDARGSSLSMVKVSQGHIKSWLTTLPPLSEQQIVVEFLDCETSKIDTLISKVRAHIEKLKEYRAAIISAAVTGKIDVREEVR